MVTTTWVLKHIVFVIDNKVLTMERERNIKVVRKNESSDDFTN